MANPTTNFGWVMPASTDLVTDLPADFAVFGDAVDSDLSTGGGYSTTATAAGTTTMTVSSNRTQFFTGSTTQTVVMPVASTLTLGWQQRIVNNSSGIVTVQSSGANTIYAVPAGGDVIFTCILASGTTAASWDYKNYIATASSSGLTKIVTATFSAATDTGTSFNSVFSATYEFYLIQISAKGSASSNLYFQIRSGSTTRTANYYGNSALVGPGASTLTNTGSNGTAQWIVMPIDTAYESIASLNLDYRSTILPQISATFNSIRSNQSGFGGLLVDNGSYDGFILSGSTGTITGSATVYGLAK